MKSLKYLVVLIVNLPCQKLPGEIILSDTRIYMVRKTSIIFTVNDFREILITILTYLEIFKCTKLQFDCMTTIPKKP